MAFLTGFLSRIGTLILGFFLDYFVRRIQSFIADWQAKQRDDKETQEAVDKINTGDLKKGLEGAAEIEDKINRNT